MKFLNLFISYGCEYVVDGQEEKVRFPRVSKNRHNVKSMMGRLFNRDPKVIEVVVFDNMGRVHLKMKKDPVTLKATEVFVLP